jgi:hypothetical protein
VTGSIPRARGICPSPHRLVPLLGRAAARCQPVGAGVTRAAPAVRFKLRRAEAPCALARLFVWSAPYLRHRAVPCFDFRCNPLQVDRRGSACANPVRGLRCASSACATRLQHRRMGDLFVVSRHAGVQTTVNRARLRLLLRTHGRWSHRDGWGVGIVFAVPPHVTAGITAVVFD